MDINGKVAIVTGGASGLGLATVEALIEAGARVTILDINAEAGHAVATRLGDAAAFVATDITSEASVSAAIQATLERYGALHICVSCAGGGPSGKTLGRNGPLALDSYSFVITLNLIGTFNVARLAAEQMAKNEPIGEAGERGVIINTASVAAFEGQVGQVAYASAKAGICGMTLPVARDLAPLGIRMMTIAPGLMDTPLLAGLPEKVLEPLVDMVQFPKRLGQAGEYARLAQQVIENAYLNGSVIRLDGAIRMEPR